MNPALLSEAIVVWIGFHREAWPNRDDQRVLDRYGPEEGSALLEAVHALDEDFYASDAKWSAPNLVAMGDQASAEFHARHPEIDELAVQALAWAYTFDYK
jgi:hypothetical protein